MSRDLARRAGSAVIWRATALAGEKLLFLLRLIILARILTPEDFGLVAIGMAAMAVIVMLTNVGVVPALVQAPASNKRHLDTAWTISLLRGLFVAITLVFAASPVATAFGVPAAQPFVQAIGVTALLRAAASIRIASLNRELRFRALALIGLTTALANTIVAIALAPSHGPWALVWGAIAGAGTFHVASFIAAPYVPHLRLTSDAAVSILRFGRWIFLAGIIAVVSDTLLRLIISRQLGAVELGLFFMAARLGYLPTQFITEIVGAVAFPIYAQLQQDRQKATNMYRKILLATTMLMLPVCAVFAYLAPALINDVLGERWQGAATVMQLVILCSVIGILGDGVAPMLKGKGQPAKVATMDFLQLGVLSATAWALVSRFGLEGAGIALTISVLAPQFLAVRYAHGLLDNPFMGAGGALLAIAVTTIAATLTAGAFLNAISDLPGILLAGVASLLVAAVVMLGLDSRFNLGLRQDLAISFFWLRSLVVRQSSGD